MAEAPPLPPEPGVCRRYAEAELADPNPDGLRDVAGRATAWALLAVAGELAEIRRELKRHK